MIQNAELTVGVFTGSQLDSLDSQDDVLQGLCIQTHLGVGYIGVDNDQIVGFDRVKLILNQKLTLAVHDIKEFQMVMGMGHGMPVSAILGTGNIQQLCGTANGKALLLI